MNWFALYTAPRAEKRVDDRLRDAGYLTYLPLHSVKRVWSDRIKEVELPLFTSYLFVSCTEAQLYDIRQIYGVARVVYYEGKPAVVRENEIEAIRQFLIKAKNLELLEGDEVEILCGSLKQQSGKIQSIRNKYFVLWIEQLNIKICVKRDHVKHKTVVSR